MKWFQHYSDSYTNLKLQELISEFGIEGYGVFWICCELVAQQGINYKIDNGKNWKKALAYIVKLPLAKIDDILTKMGEINLIDKDAYIKNSLFIPKMAEYSDDYSRRVRRVSEHTPNNVRQDKIRLDKIREENNHLRKPSSGVASDKEFKDISYSLEESEFKTPKKGKNAQAMSFAAWYGDEARKARGTDAPYEGGGYFKAKELLESKKDWNLEKLKKLAKFFF